MNEGLKNLLNEYPHEVKVTITLWDGTKIRDIVVDGIITQLNELTKRPITRINDLGSSEVHEFCGAKTYSLDLTILVSSRVDHPWENGQNKPKKQTRLERVLEED